MKVGYREIFETLRRDILDGKFDIEKTTLKGTIIDLTEDDEYVSVETTKKYNPANLPEYLSAQSA